jgi:hypothetical protein
MIVTEKVQLVWNLSNPIGSVDFIGSLQASLTYPRSHRVCRNIMYLVSFLVDVSSYESSSLLETRSYTLSLQARCPSAYFP